MGADEARRLGLVNAVVPAAQLMAKAREWADRLGASAPLALGAVKEVLRAVEGETGRGAFHTMRTADLPTYRRMLVSGDAREGISAFMERAQAEVHREAEDDPQIAA